MNVLSLFDGMSCGQIALEKVGIKVDNYYASEIDKYAMQVTKKNYPNTKHIGSVIDVKGEDLPKIDLLIGGSPCQSFSSFGDGSGMSGKSGLFWEFVRVLKETKPKYFLLENVKMKKEWEQVITNALGVKPIRINSNLLSAQNRDRLYWSNIDFELPKDKGIKYKDILDDIPFRELKPFLFKKWGDKMRIDKGLNNVINDKSNCLTTKNCHTNQYLLNENKSLMRLMNANEFERLQTVPLNYTDCVNNTERYRMLGNGWTVDIVAHIFKNIKQ
mgnify:CR=1 FL=1